MRPLRLFPLALALLLVPFAAQARFGKASHHDSDSSSSDDSHDDNTHHARAANEPPSSSGNNNDSGYRYGGGGYDPQYGGYPGWRAGFYAWNFGYTPLWVAPAVAPYPSSEYVETGAAPVVTTLELHGQAVLDSHSTPGGGAAGILFSIEGSQFGILGETNSFAIEAQDGSGNYDAIHLLDFHLTYALLTSPHGRLRLEGGLDGAIAPDVAMFGPAGGVSGVMGLFENTSLEASLRLTPYPFTKVDWSVALGYQTGPIGWQFGWRETYLDDQGNVDGVSHTDLFYGPYIGIALAM